MASSKLAERAPTADQLERHAQRLAGQYAIARAFADGDSLEEVSALLLRALVEAMDWQTAAIWVLDGDGTSLRCAAIHPTEGPLSAWAEHCTSLHLPIGTGLPGRVWETGEAAGITDTDNEANFPRRRLARESGLRHGFAFPVRVRGVLTAVVELFAADVREVDREEAAFLQGTGHQLGSFIERIDARRAVARSEARKGGILQAAVDAIVTADDDGRIIDFNPAAEALFGRRREEVVGRRIVDMLVPAGLRERHEDGLARYLATGESQILGRRIRTEGARADGSTVPIELTVTEIRLEGRPMFTAFIRDITREREAETARDRFLEILSHELRTPVTSIYGGAKLLARGSVEPDKQLELVEDVSAEADRLYRLVEDLIVLARAERGGAPTTMEPVSLDHLVERVVTAIRQRWPNVEFQLVSQSHGMPVDGDETYLEQVLRNLLTNAAKYAESGKLVEVEVEHLERESIVRVLDRGPGIDPTEAQRLFEIDYRSPKTRGLAQGSGIGLFVARWLIESMGGRIWAQPRPGGGSEFAFSLRTADAELDEVEAEPAAIVPSRAPAFVTLDVPQKSP
jgi:PAS domain S-box-containing protein